MGFQKTFETGGIGKIRKIVAEKRLDLQEAQLSMQEIELKNKVTDAFAALYINREKIKILEEAYKFLSENFEEKENISEVDQLIFEEELLNIMQAQEDAKIALEKAVLLLENLIGEDIEEEKELEIFAEDELEKKFKLEELTQTALKKRPAIIENDKELSLAESLKDLAKADRWPLLIADSGSRFFRKRNKYSAFFGIDIELPVLGVEKKEIEVSEARIEQIKETREIIEKDIEIEVEDNLKVYEFARKRLIDYEEKHLPRIEELITIIREKYEKDEVSCRDLLKAEKARLAFLANYFKALFDYKNAFSDLERAVGITLAEDTSGQANPWQNSIHQDPRIQMHRQFKPY